MPSEAAVRDCDVFWIPFHRDCETLLGTFQLTESVRYEAFSAIWRSMNFSSVFTGMHKQREIRPFCRLAFTTVYKYFLPPHSFQIRVGALYMLYGLYHSQTALPKEKIWIALKDWVHVHKFISDAINYQHLDVLYIYYSLVNKKAFYYTAMPKELIFNSKRRLMSKAINEEFQEYPKKVSELVNEDVLEEIRNVQDHYERIKQAVAAPTCMTPIHLTKQLEECALGFLQWQEMNAATRKSVSASQSNKHTLQTETSDTKAKLSSIKEKTYYHLPKGSRSRHRQLEDTSGSGTDNQELLVHHKKRRPSLKERTCKELGKEDSVPSEQQRQYWLLSSKEEDKAGMKRPPQKHKFKW